MMGDAGEIRLALCGVGNCASNFIQGLQYYAPDQSRSPIGLMHVELGGYRVSDITPVAAFDIDERKVGRDLSEAIFAEPNCTPKFQEVPHLGVPVKMGPVLDGLTPALAKYVTRSQTPACDIDAVLEEFRPDVLALLLPTGAEEAAVYYARAAFRHGIGIVNGIPVLLCSNEEMVALAKDAGAPMVGDDFKSQIGGTVLHRGLLELLLNRGIHVDGTYQLNYGGNTDFANLMDRGETKHASKLRGLKGTMDLGDAVVSVNVSHLTLLGDTKICRITVEGRNFGDQPITLEAKLSVVDSANSSGVLVDAIRACKVARDRGVGGPLESFSSYLMKSPPVQKSDADARRLIEEFLAEVPASSR